MLGDKLRFRFSKTGVLRLLSHHDLMRCFERMLRRAGVPFKSTSGFHPTPRVVFALSLPLGVVGLDECVEIELTEPRDLDESRSRLNESAPSGLEFTRGSVVPMNATARPRRVAYRFPIPRERAEEAAAACADLLQQERVWVDRQKPSAKQLNIRPYLRSLAVHDSVLSLDLWVTQTGTARADELLKLLKLSDLLDSGAALTRDVVELHDEITASQADHPPDGPAETLPLAAAIAPRRTNEHPSPEARWGATLSGPVVE